MALTALNDPSQRFIDDDTITVVAKLNVRLHAPERQPAKPEKPVGYDDKLFLAQPVPEHCTCSICLCVMDDPVCCSQGHKCVLCACATLRRRLTPP